MEATNQSLSHLRKVERIARDLRVCAEAGRRAFIDKGGVHHVVPLPGDPRFAGGRVDVSDLNEIIEIDVERRLCTTEPNVTFSRLVEATLEHGLAPMVVPELEGITVGGAVAGCSVESMSFRYGGFHDGCVAYEMVSGGGEVMTVSREVEPLLFEMLHGSYGTLGVVSKLVFKLVPAKPYVRLSYERVSDAAAFGAALERATGDAELDFLDAIVHGPRDFVLCKGSFVDSAPYTSDLKARPYYKTTARRHEDFLRTRDYFFRYDTDCHWLSRTIPPLEWGWVRRLAGDIALGSDNLITWSNRLAPVLRRLLRRPDVVCDVFIPARRFDNFWQWYLDVMDHFPLWIVPYKTPPGMYPWVNAELAGRIDGELLLDCAVYGKRNTRPEVDYSELLERKTHELDGVKTLISRNHYTNESFWRVYHRENYESAKRRLDPRGVFPTVFDKLARVS